jgi:hypothetical protein
MTLVTWELFGVYCPKRESTADSKALASGYAGAARADARSLRGCGRFARGYALLEETALGGIARKGQRCDEMPASFSEIAAARFEFAQGCVVEGIAS